MDDPLSTLSQAFAGPSTEPEVLYPRHSSNTHPAAVHIAKDTEPTNAQTGPSSSSRRVGASSNRSQTDKGKGRTSKDNAFDDGAEEFSDVDDNEDDNEDAHKSKPPQIQKKVLACPYYAADPLYYCTERKFGSYAECAARKGFKEIGDVK